MEFGMGDSKKRLAVSGKAETREIVDSFAVSGKDWPELKSALIAKMGSEIGRFICAECANCQHMKPRTEEFQDHANMRTNLALQVVCGKVTERSGSSECPDGFDVHRRGWKSGVETADMTGFGDYMTRRVVTGHSYSEESPDPLTMNHLTLDQRARQCDELMMSIERGTTPGRYDRTMKATTFELQGGRQVTFHQNGGVTGSTTRGKPEPVTSTISWPRQKLTDMDADTFNREYMADFNAPREPVMPYVPAPPKDKPIGPDAGTW